MTRSLLLLLTISLAFSSCSHFSKSARQQRAYSKYVRKSSLARAKQSSRFIHSTKPEMPPAPGPTNAVVTTQSGPQAMTMEGSGQ